MDGQVLLVFVLCDDAGRQITIVINDGLWVHISKNYSDEVIYGELNHSQIPYVLGIVEEVYSYNTYHAYLMELAKASRLMDIINR